MFAAADVATILQELIALFGAIAAMLGSWLQGRQALHKAKSELGRARIRVDEHVDVSGGELPGLMRWPRELRRLHQFLNARPELKGDTAPDSDQSAAAARRDVHHFVAVARLWLLILLGAFLAAAAAALELLNDLT